jgi:lysophospholipase L1-like esterase
MKKILKWIAIGLVTVGVALAGALFFFGGNLNTPEFWESEIIAFETADAENFPDKGLILFTGSSSIRMWSDLESDMAPLRVLNRGFGGAHMDHVLHFADRIITPYEPRAIVLYVGDNDIGAGKTPATVEADFRKLVAHVRQEQPTVPIYFLTIKASRLRWDLWPVMDEANRRIAAIASDDPEIRVIDVSAPMIERGDGGEPPSDLFPFDGLHLSEEGYALWTSVIRPRLIAELGAG